MAASALFASACNAAFCVCSANWLSALRAPGSSEPPNVAMALRAAAASTSGSSAMAIATCISARTSAFCSPA